MLVLLAFFAAGDDYFLGKDKISLNDIVESGGKIYVRARRLEKDLEMVCRMSVDEKTVGVYREGVGGRAFPIGNGQAALVHSQDLFLSLDAIDGLAKVRRDGSKVEILPKEKPTIDPKRADLGSGDRMIDFALPLLKDPKQTVQLSKHRGKRVVVVLWSSWDGSRGDSRKWQELYAKHKGHDLVVVSVAVDAAGEERPRRYVDRTVTHPVALDADWRTLAAFGVKSFPGWILIDELGFLRAMGTGIADAETAFLKLGKAEASTFSVWARDLNFDPASESWGAAIRGAVTRWREGKPGEGVDVLEDFLKRHDSELLLRRQKWAVEFPEKIYADSLDEAWMREQEEKEKRGG